MRAEPTILHVDLDAFFAAVEQRDKPSLRGKPVVVGGVGGRGVVATASYEARAFGVHSAMPTAEARRRCPNAAFLAGRFGAYRETSRAVMGLLRSISPLVEPLSLDEAFVDLAAAELADTSVTGVSAFGRRLKEQVAEVTGGLNASVGIGTSKFIAKIASDLDKPDGLVVVAPGMERDLLRPMQVTVIPGVGPATAESLRRIGVHTVADLEQISVEELVRVVGKAHGRTLFELARAEDDRPVVAEREVKSISVEDTYETDHVDRNLLAALVDRQSAKVAERLRKARLSGRTVTLKVRLHDFSTHTRSATLPGPTDDTRTVARVARTLLTEVDTSGGVRLLGVGVSGLADWIQEDLFADAEDGTVDEVDEETESVLASLNRWRGWVPGMDVEHDELGRGWVWGSGRGVVTVRFETAEAPAGKVVSLAADDPALRPWTPPVSPEDGSEDAPGPASG
ncbi:DNA polymerase IV [Marmoricola sp. RAF53]|uniref:DNA polymerase IV n=1 Tax=Marmoricola sp. RAF53 TaxID=3233059 RepID=UPI003F965767